MQSDRGQAFFRKWCVLLTYKGVSLGRARLKEEIELQSSSYLTTSSSVLQEGSMRSWRDSVTIELETSLGGSEVPRYCSLWDGKYSGAESERSPMSRSRRRVGCLQQGLALRLWETQP